MQERIGRRKGSNSYPREKMRMLGDVLTYRNEITYFIASEQTSHFAVKFLIPETTPLNVREQNNWTSSRSRSTSAQEIQCDGERLQVTAVGVIDECVSRDTVLHLQTHFYRSERCPRKRVTDQFRCDQTSYSDGTQTILDVGGVGERDDDLVSLSVDNT